MTSSLYLNNNNHEKSCNDSLRNSKNRKHRVVNKNSLTKPLEMNEQPVSKSNDEKPTIQRSSSGKLSFTAGIKNQMSINETGRFANLNQSFNNVASDFRRKINNLESTSESRLLLTTTNGGGLIRTLSQRVKHQVQSSLSDPLKRGELLGRIGAAQSHYNGAQCKEECGHCTICQNILTTTTNNNNLSGNGLQNANLVRKRINILSNKLQLPKFLTDSNESDYSDRHIG